MELASRKSVVIVALPVRLKTIFSCTDVSPPEREKVNVPAPPLVPLISEALDFVTATETVLAASAIVIVPAALVRLGLGM